MYKKQEKKLVSRASSVWEIAAGTKAAGRGKQRCVLKDEMIKVRSEDQNGIHWEEKFCEMVLNQGTEIQVGWVWRQGAMTERGKLH